MNGLLGCFITAFADVDVTNAPLNEALTIGMTGSENSDVGRRWSAVKSNQSGVVSYW
ncbi:MAG: hypothetical protein Q8O48_08215 [Anaerolineales bacterium]|nr:hypothetical protein [Anaerolineales bacterium]